MSLASLPIKITWNNLDIAGTYISCVVDRDVNQPDSAAIVVTNQNQIWSKDLDVGVDVKIQMGNEVVFLGEAVGYEPQYKGTEPQKLLIRAFNKMHRLSRKRKSVTFQGKDDQTIIKDVLTLYNLTLNSAPDPASVVPPAAPRPAPSPPWNGAVISYKHVYQHNQSDLEFIRVRAARIGCHVWGVGTNVYVREPDFNGNPVGGPSGPLTLTGDELHSFTPRLSSAAVVDKVTVKGWDPETKALITGTSSQAASGLGSKTGVQACQAKFAKDETFTVDHPIWSKPEADALAKARLRDLNLNFITGEAECHGALLIDAKVDLGMTVEITANKNNANDPFNGRYYIMGITHRNTPGKGNDGGLVTILRLARDAQK